MKLQRHEYDIVVECNCDPIRKGAYHRVEIDRRYTLGPVPIPRWAFGPLVKVLRHWEVHEHNDDNNCGPTNGRMFE